MKRCGAVWCEKAEDLNQFAERAFRPLGSTGWKGCHLSNERAWKGSSRPSPRIAATVGVVEGEPWSPFKHAKSGRSADAFVCASEPAINPERNPGAHPETYGAVNKVANTGTHLSAVRHDRIEHELSPQPVLNSRNRPHGATRRLHCRTAESSLPLSIDRFGPVTAICMLRRTISQSPLTDR
jgi:hypothetical protein